MYRTLVAGRRSSLQERQRPRSSAPCPPRKRGLGLSMQQPATLGPRQQKRTILLVASLHSQLIHERLPADDALDLARCVGAGRGRRIGQSIAKHVAEHSEAPPSPQAAARFDGRRAKVATSAIK